MEYVNPNKFRKDFYKYLRSIVEYDNVVNLNTKDGNAIIISEDEYDALIETVYLYSIPGMTEKLIEGKNTALEDCEELNQ